MIQSAIRLLLIEDNPSDERLIKELLRKAHDVKFEIQSVSRLASALQRLEEQTTDIVLLDLSLPDSAGLQTLNSFRSEFPAVPVIVLTGLDDTETGLQAVQAGAQNYLLKDEISTTLLTRTARYAIERQHIEKTLRKREEEYRSLIDDVFDNSTMAVFILDKDFHIVWLNETTEVYFGIDRDTAIGMDNRGFILNTMRHIFDDPDHFVDALFSGYERQTISNTFICHVLGTEDGTVQERWLEHSSKAISAGLYAGGRIEQYADITEHVRIEVAEREQRALAEALSDTALALTSTLDLDEVLDRILENVQYVVPHDNAKILLINGDIARVVRTRGYKNFDPDDQPLGVQFKLLEEPHLRRMFESGAPVTIPDIHADPEWRLLPGDEWLHACISAPVRFQNQTIGYLNLLCTEPDKLTPDHAKRLQLFAAQAAIAIQNARHHQQSRELVAVEERQRIARDLHDAVSQSLFSASVIAQSLPRIWQENPEKVMPQLKYLDELTQGALTEMRMLLMELRPEALQDIGLDELLRRMVITLKTRKQIPITAAVDPMPELPHEVKVALYRIAQESLNNVAKHSQAKRVSLELSRDSHCITLMICDDGVGFENQKAAETSYGLKIMRERAEEIGARLSIESKAGAGTIVRVQWACDSLSRVARPDELAN